MPPIRALPPDTEYKTKHKGTMKAWWSSSGHIVVKPVLNGTEGVYMILDTGMSRFYVQSPNLLHCIIVVLNTCLCIGHFQTVCEIHKRLNPRISFTVKTHELLSNGSLPTESLVRQSSLKTRVPYGWVFKSLDGFTICTVRFAHHPAVV